MLTIAVLLCNYVNIGVTNAARILTPAPCPRQPLTINYQPLTVNFPPYTPL
jgi:hypothetical protein